MSVTRAAPWGCEDRPARVQCGVNRLNQWLEWGVLTLSRWRLFLLRSSSRRFSDSTFPP